MTEWPTEQYLLSPDVPTDPLSIDVSPLTSETELKSLAEQRVLNDLKERLKRLLSEHPRNYSLVAKKLNIDRRAVEKLVQEFEQELEDEYLDEIEENVIRTIQGKPITDENFRFNDSLKVLERLRAERWSNRKPAKRKSSVGNLKDVMGMLRRENKDV